MSGAEPAREVASRAVLVAGIGNVFHGDDGFGVEVVRRLGERPLPPGVDVADFGMRCVDLGYALGGGYRTAVLVEASARGRAPGTVSLVEPGGARGLGLRGTLDPIELARDSGRVPTRVVLVTCEPSPRAADGAWEMRLSRPVAAAVDEAVRLIERLAAEECEPLLAKAPV